MMESVIKWHKEAKRSAAHYNMATLCFNVGVLWVLLNKTTNPTITQTYQPNKGADGVMFLQVIK